MAVLFQGNAATKGSTRVSGTMGKRAYAGLTLHDPGGARKYLNVSERRRFQRALDRLPRTVRLFCLVLMWSGGRVSEVLALTPAALDLDTGVVSFITLKRRKPGLVRQVPLPHPLIEELSDAFDLRVRQRDPTLVSRRLWPWTRITAWRRVKKVMIAAGIMGLAASPKGLRHTFGVAAFQAHVPPHIIQRWLGHASLRTTAIYGDVIGAEERAFAASVWRNW